MDKAGNTKGGRKYHCTIDLLFDWFGLVYFANKNKNCHQSYNRFQTSQTGGQGYIDTFPFSIPWTKAHSNFLTKALVESFRVTKDGGDNDFSGRGRVSSLSNIFNWYIVALGSNPFCLIKGWVTDSAFNCSGSLKETCCVQCLLSNRQILINIKI